MLETLQVLKNFDADRVDLDALVALAAAAPLLQEAYRTYGLPVPTWLTENVRALKQEIGNRQRDFKARELKTLQARLEARRAEKQTVEDLEARIQALSTELEA